MERYLAKSKPSDDLAAAKAAKAEQNKFGSNKKLPMPESFYKKAKVRYKIYSPRLTVLV